MTVTPDHVRSALETYVRAWATGDKALLLSLFAEDGALEDPVGTPPFAGHAAIGRFWDFAHQDADREVMPRLEEIRACGNAGILRFTMQVRIPATHQALDLSIIEYAEFDEAGKIGRLRAFWDESSIAVPEGWAMFAPNIDEAYAS